MVVTRSARPQAGVQATSAESSRQKIKKPNFYNSETYKDFEDDSFCENSEKNLRVQKHQCFNMREEKQDSVSPFREVTKQSFVEVDRWNEEKKSTMKTSDWTEFGDGGGSDEEEHTVVVLSSDESQQSENSENEEDTLCFVENSGQKETLNGNSEDTSRDKALFVIDTTPGLSADKNFYLDEEDKAKHDSKDNEFSDEDNLLNSTKSKLLKLTSSSIDPGLSIKQLGGLYINFNADKLQLNKRTLTQIKEKKKNEFLTVLDSVENLKAVSAHLPPSAASPFVFFILVNDTKTCFPFTQERQKTAGDGWFGMKAPELTDELKNDLKALKMRASMDPKRFYKKNDRDGFPKYFQVGTIVDNPADFYHSRIPKKQRKRTIVEELLADSEFRRYNRRKYSEIMAEKAANAAGKKFRKKKKFRN
ncbi:deoxynucleotidyltransferase terminal-interacting protein 2 [Camelus ferus]|nr:deoxynucleotidyltransferase terminal-interacting protein 2 [Camelus ferus]